MRPPGPGGPGCRAAPLPGEWVCCASQQGSAQSGHSGVPGPRAAHHVTIHSFARSLLHSQMLIERWPSWALS